MTWDMSKYRHAAPVWWASWKKSRRRKAIARAVIALAAILYGIAVWFAD